MALVVFLAAPAQAAWYGFGSFEPDTPEDASGAWMWTEPPQEPGSRVYFNAFPSVQGLTLNPNVGVAGSRLLPVGTTEWRAMLGVWVDCNRDGYVGMAETGLAEYRNEMLVDKSLCPVAPWGWGVHNDGIWVTELLMVGMVDPCEFREDEYRMAECGGLAPFNFNRVVVYPNDTFVWGDEGLPGAPGPGSCVGAPLPRGTTSGTGALLAYLDCHAGGALTGLVNEADPEGGLGLGFEDPEHPQRSDSLLNQHFPVNLFGNPTTGQRGLLEADTGRPAFTAWDCSSPRDVEVQDPTGLDGEVVTDPTGGGLTGPRVLPVVGRVTLFEDHDEDPDTPGRHRVVLGDGEGTLVWAPRVGVPTVDAGGSAWDGAVALVDGPRGDCDGETPQPAENAYPFGAVEGDVASQAAFRRTQPAFTFEFYDGYRSSPPLYATLGRNFPTDFGNPYQRNSHGGAMWVGSGFSVTDPFLLRRDAVEPEAPRVFSFYAWVPPTLSFLDLPPGGAREYGADACSAIGAGVADENGWACDPTQWWRDDAGRDITPRFREGERLGRVVGDLYTLRDVDCYDGALAAGVPVGAGLTAFSPAGLCAAPEGVEGVR